MPGAVRTRAVPRVARFFANQLSVFPGAIASGRRTLPFATSSWDSAYGGPDAFKRFVRAAHEHEIAVLVDVVFNHLRPISTCVGLTAAEGEWGGIYFCNDYRAVTGPYRRPRRPASRAAS
jgi:hypothetical protein